jgi:hypothetical protein
MRDFNPVVGPGSDYTRSVIDARPGAINQRSLAPLPGEVVTVLAEGVGGMVLQHLVTGSFEAERFEPGDDGNVLIGGEGGADFPRGSATKVTGKPVKGQTAGKGMI